MALLRLCPYLAFRTCVPVIAEWVQCFAMTLVPSVATRVICFSPLSIGVSRFLACVAFFLYYQVSFARLRSRIRSALFLIHRLSTYGPLAFLVRSPGAPAASSDYHVDVDGKATWDLAFINASTDFLGHTTLQTKFMGLQKERCGAHVAVFSSMIDVNDYAFGRVPSPVAGDFSFKNSLLRAD